MIPRLQMLRLENPRSNMTAVCSTQVSARGSSRSVEIPFGRPTSASYPLVTADQHEKIIALGSNIGSGLFIGTGKALAYGGAGNMLIAYLIVCSGVWANVQALIEMTIMFPTSGNFIDYAGRWVDPAVAFGAGFAEWLGMTVTSLRIGLKIGACADRLIRMDGSLWRRGRVFLHTDQLLG